MKGGKHQAVGTIELAQTRFSRDGKHGPIDLTFRAVRDEEGGAIRLVVTMPKLDQVVLPDDLGVLMQCFGWGMASLVMDLYRWPEPTIWSNCCQQIGKVEHCLRFE